jgi:hypothetical protein
MILGMSPLVFIHTLASLVAIAAGFVVLAAMFRNDRADGWTKVFLALTIFTSASGFVLPAAKFMPSHAVGILSLILLAACCYARYAKNMAGAWRTGYVLTAVAALYFNVFVLVVQLFLKVPALHELAPNGNEPPFAVAQAVVLVAFVVAGFKVGRRFHPAVAEHREDDEDTAPA